MRRNWNAGAVALIAGSTTVALLVLASVLWWQHGDRPWPLVVWGAVKGLLWSKTVFKVAIAAGLGLAIAWRAAANRLRARRDPATPVAPGGEPPAWVTAGSGGQVDRGGGAAPAALGDPVAQRHEA